jgi:hypothetical protein
MTTRLWLACLVSACAATPDADLSFTMAEASTELLLRYPVFAGDDRAAQLNTWVAERWGNDHSCVAEAGAYRELRVQRLTPSFAVFVDEGEAYCQNAPHPSTWNEQMVVEIVTGKTVDVWERLSPSSQARLQAQVSALGMWVRRDDECADAYRDGLPWPLVVNLGEDDVQIEPDFPYATRACVEALSMSRDEFRLLEAWWPLDDSPPQVR